MSYLTFFLNVIFACIF